MTQEPEDRARMVLRPRITDTGDVIVALENDDKVRDILIVSADPTGGAVYIQRLGDKAFARTDDGLIVRIW
jgi:hypothetical protein